MSLSAQAYQQLILVGIRELPAEQLAEVANFQSGKHEHDDCTGLVPVVEKRRLCYATQQQDSPTNAQPRRR